MYQKPTEFSLLYEAPQQHFLRTVCGGIAAPYRCLCFGKGGLTLSGGKCSGQSLAAPAATPLAAPEESPIEELSQEATSEEVIVPDFAFGYGSDSVYNSRLIIFGCYGGSSRLNDFKQFCFGDEEFESDIPESTLISDLRALVSSEVMSDIPLSEKPDCINFAALSFTLDLVTRVASTTASVFDSRRQLGMVIGDAKLELVAET